MTADETSIRAACQAFGHAMQAGDLTAMQGLWDRSYGHLVYQPEEYERACRSWDEIVAYLNYIPGVVESIPSGGRLPLMWRCWGTQRWCTGW